MPDSIPPEQQPSRAALIFAGGRATRLGGVNKALLDIGGQRIIDRLLLALEPLVHERLILTNDASLQQVQDARLVFDPSPHAGVLAALATGLDAARADMCLTVACDMPFVSRAVFERMLQIQAAADADVVIPRTSGHLEPMHAVYRRVPVLEAIRAALARGEQRMISYFDVVRVRQVDQSELSDLDRDQLAFFNVNTPDDLARARQLATS